MVISYRVRFINTIMIGSDSDSAISIRFDEHTDGERFLSYKVYNSNTSKTIPAHMRPRRDGGGERRPHHRGGALLACCSRSAPRALPITVVDSEGTELSSCLYLPIASSSNVILGTYKL